MREPVVASDGHTYERAAIEAHFARGGETRSPLTREVLSEHLFPNHALRRRIQEYEGEMMRVAETAHEAGRERSSAKRRKTSVGAGSSTTAIVDAKRGRLVYVI